MGDWEPRATAFGESMLGYHSWSAGILTCGFESSQGTLLGGQFDWGGRLLKGNGGAQRLPQCGWKSHEKSVKAEGSLTARQTSGADTKVGLSDPAV